MPKPASFRNPRLLLSLRHVQIRTQITFAPGTFPNTWVYLCGPTQKHTPFSKPGKEPPGAWLTRSSPPEGQRDHLPTLGLMTAGLVKQPQKGGWKAPSSQSHLHYTTLFMTTSLLFFTHIPKTQHHTTMELTEICEHVQIKDLHFFKGKWQTLCSNKYFYISLFECL